MADGGETYFCITDGVDFELVRGTLTYGGSDTLTRTEVLDSSNGDALVNWGTGTKTVFGDHPAAKRVYVDANGRVGIGASSGAADSLFHANYADTWSAIFENSTGSPVAGTTRVDLRLLVPDAGANAMPAILRNMAVDTTDGTGDTELQVLTTVDGSGMGSFVTMWKLAPIYPGCSAPVPSGPYGSLSIAYCPRSWVHRSPASSPSAHASAQPLPHDGSYQSAAQAAKRFSL